MDVIYCPKCGSIMVLRIARSGKFAGKQFYGCSRYPKCNAIVDFSDNDLTETSPNENDYYFNNSKELLKQIPRNIVARSRFPDFQVKFFESVSLTEELLEMLDFEFRENPVLKAFSQWRVDFSSDNQKYINDANQKQLISILEKILTRGRITLLSPFLENQIKQLFNISESDFESINFSDFFDSLISFHYPKAKIENHFDSFEEVTFYNEILSESLGINYENYVIPQLNLESLLSITEDEYPHHRVDFLISHPKLEEIIVVEIDGLQHKSNPKLDGIINDILNKNGISIIRIPANEIKTKRYVQLKKLIQKFSNLKNNFSNFRSFQITKKIKYSIALKLAHQIQLTLIQALQFGFLDLNNPRSWKIVTDIDCLNLFDESTAKTIVKLTVYDFLELVRNISKLYSMNILEGDPSIYLDTESTGLDSDEYIYISFTNRYLNFTSTFFIQNIYFPFHISKESFPTKVAEHVRINPERKTLQFLLKYIFRKNDFWEGQYEGICRLLKGKDALLLLPTGGGKSMVYQFTSMLLPGRTVVIDPIISLMEDQIDNLFMMGIDRCIAITSKIGDPNIRDRILKLFGQGEYIFVFIAPERFQTNSFRDALRMLTTHTPISLIVVDEAHCVSEWGHDFRTAYLNIGRTTRIYCKTNDYTPPLVAMTGTASRAVLKDVKRELQIEDFEAIITPKTFDRKELNYEVIYASSQEKLSRLIGYLRNNLPDIFSTTFSNFYQPLGKKTYAGLIFCPHVGGSFGVTEVAQSIRNDLKIQTEIYSGKEPKGISAEVFSQVKSQVTRNYKRNKIPLLVCTKAFGMGIDKPNIRYTIHFGLPPSIESFYQEAGRAGRDRRKAQCCVIVSNDYPKRTERLLNPNTKIEEIAEMIKDLKWEENDDITRVMFFHVNSFRGITSELEDVQEILNLLGDISLESIRTLPVNEYFNKKAGKYKEPREVAEKAIHRLLLIGVIKDYTIDYANNEFTIHLTGFNKEEIIQTYGRYVEGYLHSRKHVEVEKAIKLLDLPFNKFVLKMVELLLHFIYDVIEKGRRRALYEILLAFSNSPDDNTIRQKILRYLEVTQFSEKMDEILQAKDAGLIECRDLIESITSTNEAAELRGQVSRMLESYPDHPSLLMLRALTEIYCAEYSIEVVKENFIAAIFSAKTNYGINLRLVFEFASWAINMIGKRNDVIESDLIYYLCKSNIREELRLLVEFLPKEKALIPAWLLLNKLNEKCRKLIG